MFFVQLFSLPISLCFDQLEKYLCVKWRFFLWWGCGLRCTQMGLRGYKTGTPKKIFKKLVNKNVIKHSPLSWNITSQQGPSTDIFLKKHPTPSPFFSTSVVRISTIMNWSRKRQTKMKSNSHVKVCDLKGNLSD